MAKTKKRNKSSTSKKMFFILLVVTLLVGGLNIAKANGLLIPDQPAITVHDNTVQLNSMTLEQKIAQMVVVHGGKHNLHAWKQMGIGGIHLFAMAEQELFTNIISLFQQDMQIPFFVTGDLEGCQNLFGNFKQFPSASEISTVEAAYLKGKGEGQYLKELGFSINFAPVVDLEDEIWNCRTFPGDERRITELANAYINGLQEEGILATAKHYPGKTLVVRDPHKFIVAASIEEKDIYPYQHVKEQVEGIMVSHIITFGAVPSGGVPSVASEHVIADLKQDYHGLVISDEINMLGLKEFYPSLDEMYVAVCKAGNDIILNFNEDPLEVQKMIAVVADAVRNGDIPQDHIDRSVTKVLQAKGFQVG